MPVQECAECQHSIRRIPGIHCSSVLCTKCSRLFHPDCLNPSSSGCLSICRACEAALSTRSSRPTPTSYRQSLSSASTSSQRVSSVKQVAATQEPTDLSVTSAIRYRSSLPESLSQPQKVFRALSTSLILETMSDPTIPPGTPAWAVVLFEQLTGIRNDIGSLSQKIDTLHTRVTAVETNINLLNDKTSTMQSAHAYRDTCEVRISGIPLDLLSRTESLSGAIHKIFTAMDCAHAVRHIYKIRVFDGKASNKANAATGTAAVQFSCTAARDDVLFSGRKLKDQTAGKLFDTGGEASIYVNQILPSAIHKLGAISRAKARELKYPPPVVRPAGVFMRRSLDGPLIPITFAEELQDLTPNPPSN